MDFNHNNVRSALKEDRLSSLPLELIIQILSRVDTKLAIQTCLLLFPRWKRIWTLMPSLNFSTSGIKNLAKFSKFVTRVLYHRNHQVEVSSVNLYFRGADTQNFVTQITNYAISHNVQELILDVRPKNKFPLYLFSSQTLKHLTFRTYTYDPCLTPITPWDFPALTTLYLKDISLCDDRRKSLDIFSRCVNLQNLTLEFVKVNAKVFDIITPRLSNLTLAYYRGSNVINVTAPQLKNLTIIGCSLINDLNIPSGLGLSSFCYKGYHPPHWFKNYHLSVNKVTVSLRLYGLKRQEDA
ncbi:F-box/FBD/LRR-repeat protein At3g26920-like [Rutidosis leptorrhynchoides]|uniref:F-box/FBD/LRR-repeat protein At3g26920-like n=1 Tax=Rutidosis leptorrhynchoides TaxID=125765 RepID=UPI003A98E6A9